jgi:hypothetical protein
MIFSMFPANSRAKGLPRSLGEFQARGKAAENDNGSKGVRRIVNGASPT